MNETLLQNIRAYQKSGVFLAFSGGVDSTLLLALCVREQVPVTAVTFQTTLHPRCDLENAKAVAEKLGAAHLVLNVDEMSVPEILQNPPDRCYHCKKHLFQTLLELAGTRGCETVLDGTNADDLGEYRPGLRALRELGIRSPLAECGISKVKVRMLAAELGLEPASRPSSPCLATRLPYGVTISTDLLKKIEKGEEFLKESGFPIVRLRVHPAEDGGLARIEVPTDRLKELLSQREQVAAYLLQLGFAQITMDLEGFRSGSYDQRRKTPQP